MNNRKFKEVIRGVKKKFYNLELSQNEFFEKNINYIYDKYKDNSQFISYLTSMFHEYKDKINKHEYDIKNLENISNHRHIQNKDIDLLTKIYENINNDIYYTKNVFNYDIKNIVQNCGLNEKDNNIYIIYQNLRKIENLYKYNFYNIDISYREIEFRNKITDITKKNFNDIKFFREYLDTHDRKSKRFNRIKSDIIDYINMNTEKYINDIWSK